MGIEQAASGQQAAVIANLSAAEGVDQVLRSEIEREVEKGKAAKREEGVLKQALNGKNAKLGTQILAKLTAKLSQTLPAETILDNLQQDYQDVISPQKDTGTDWFELKSPDYEYYLPKHQRQKQNAGQNAESQGKDDGNAPATRQAVREYIGAYTQMLVSGGAEQKKKANQMENRLLQDKGMSAKELQGIKVQAANSVRSEILKQVKREYLKQLVTSAKTVEGIVARKSLNKVFDFAFFNEEIGGYDFGGKDGHLQGAVDRATKETGDELKGFVQEKLTQALTKRNTGGETKEVEKEIDELLKLGEKIGFNLNAYLKNLPKLKDDLGMLPVLYFDDNTAGTGANGGSNQERHSYQYTVEEEKEVLTDKLRGLICFRAVHGDIRTVLTTQFKMMKTKNGLIRLGVQNFDEIETQGRAMAKFRLFEMLREAFEERATYAKLSGSAWTMTEKKIKTIIRNLEKLGIVLSKIELDSIQDKANEKMYREAEHELSLVNAAIGIRGEIKFFTTKRKKLTEVLVRLAEESGFAKPGDELGLVKEAV